MEIIVLNLKVGIFMNFWCSENLFNPQSYSAIMIPEGIYLGSLYNNLSSLVSLSSPCSVGPYVIIQHFAYIP
jgi:hypothetical protein